MESFRYIDFGALRYGRVEYWLLRDRIHEAHDCINYRDLNHVSLSLPLVLFAVFVCVCDHIPAMAYMYLRVKYTLHHVTFFGWFDIFHRG